MKRLLLALCLLSASLSAAERPNVIFILADDLGWGDLACYGHPYAKTPNLDKLAADGTRFTKFHATGVTCCPARTGLMTGRFPATFQKYPSDFGFGDRVTITELLKKNGYATGHVGKWHIGSVMEPGTYGIDVIGAEEKEGGKRKQATGDRSRDAPMYDQAIAFIEKHSRAERDSLPKAARRADAGASGNARPFYLNIWDHISHHPVNPSPAVLERFGALELDESKFTPAMREKFATCKKLGADPAAHLRAFLADVKSMDDEIGRLLAKLDELGLRENTLVVFSSDQGAAPLQDQAALGEKMKKKLKYPQDSAVDQIRLNSMGYAGPLFRGGKHTDLEGGVCVPFIMRWPSKVPAGRVDDESVLSGADWLPSLCAITGISINAADFDGENSSAAWLGGTHARTKPLFWKTNTESSDPSMLAGSWKLHGSHRKKGTVTLYNLATDPGEQNDLSAKEPAMLKKLTEQLNAWTATLPKTYEHGDGKED